MRAWIAGRPGDDVAGREPGAIVALPVGHHASGLPHDHAARGDVPRAELLLEVAVEHARGRPRQVETRGARARGDPRTCAAHARTRGSTRRAGRAWRGRETRSRGSRTAGVAAADADRRAVAERAPAPAGREHRAEHRRGDHADHRLPRRDEPDRHADHREAVQEVGGAVERVDEPPDLGPLAAALLAEEGDLRRGVRQRRADRALAREVDRRSPSRRDPSRGTCARARMRRARPRSPAATADRARSRAVGRDRGRLQSSDRSRAVELARAARRGARACPRRPAGGDRPVLGDRRGRGRGVDDRRAGLPADEQPAEVVPRRGADRGGSRGTRRRCPRPRRTARAPTSRALGTVASRCDAAAARRSRPPSGRSARSSTAGAGAPSSHAPSPRTAVYRAPVAPFATQPTAGRRHRARTARSPSTGCCAAQFVDPSTGSSTTVISASVRPGPPRFLAEHAQPAACRTGSDGGVGDGVEVVLAAAVGARPPLGPADESATARPSLRVERRRSNSASSSSGVTLAASTSTTAL